MSVCVCFYECLYPLPPQYHLKGKKVYNLSSNLVSERFHLSPGNINSFMSMFRESLWLGKGRGFSRVACSNPFSTALRLAPWSPLSPAAWLWASQPHWEPHPRSVPFPVAALASPACASAGRQKSDPWGWQAALAFTIPPCYPDPCWGHWNNLFLCYTSLGIPLFLCLPPSQHLWSPLSKVESSTPLANSESWGSDRVSTFSAADPVLIIKLPNTSLSLGGHSKHLADS